MAWYYWALICLAVVLIAGFKIWYVPRWLKKIALKKEEKQRLMEEDD